MRKIVEKLRQKPAHVRDQIAIFSAFMVTGIVAFFWLASLTTEYGSQEAKSSFNDSFSPFRVLGDNAKDAIDRSKAQINSLSPDSIKSQEPEAAVSVSGDGVVNLGEQDNRSTDE